MENTKERLIAVSIAWLVFITISMIWLREIIFLIGYTFPILVIIICERENRQKVRYSKMKNNNMK